MIGKLRQSKEHEFEFYVEYEGQWQQSTIELMEAYGDNPDNFKCIKEIPIHPDDTEMLLDYPSMIPNLVDKLISFDFMSDGKEMCAALKLY
jgi:hypothetical protein